MKIPASLFVSGLLLCGGCATQATVQNDTRKNNTDAAEETPRINSIGIESTLTFETGAADEAAALVIPIECSGTHQDDGLSLNVGGSISAESGRDFGVRHAKGDADGLFELVLTGRYVKKLRTGDRLEVLAALQPQSGTPQTFRRAYAHRVFTLYEINDYRRLVLPARVPAHDFQAFPIPETEVRYLFGPVVQNSYFVVRLTLRNSSEVDKLVDAGLISATGRAIVVPGDKDQTLFTVPVKISPQGATQVFAVLDDRELQSFRARSFRALEFIGALGTAAVTAYGGTVDLKSGISLFTGVAVPEGRKAWPDGWPGYKRNLVNFSMPELTKVPRQSASTPKFLFFAKRDLELLVSDQRLFERTPVLSLGSGRLSNKGPSVRVISIAFDALEIPFETVFDAGVADRTGQFNRVQTSLAAQIARISLLAERWRGGLATATVPFSAITPRVAELEAALAKLGAPAPATQPLIDALRDLQVLAKAFPSKPDGSDGAFASLLFTARTDRDFSQSVLELRREQLGLMPAGLLKYSEAEPERKTLDDTDRQIRHSQALADFIPRAANALASAGLAVAVQAIASAGSAAEPAAQEEVQKTVAGLRAARTFPALPEFDATHFKAIEQE